MPMNPNRPTYTATITSNTTGAITLANIISGNGYAYVDMSYAGAAALAIPGAAAVPGNSRIRVLKSGSAGAITITPASGTIAGGATHTAIDATSDTAVFVAVGSDWKIEYSVIA